jgi:hypothetical protein
MGVLILALTGAAFSAAPTVSASPAHNNARLGSPTHASLVAYAKAHGGLKVAGPYAGNPGWFGAFSTKRAIVVVDFAGHWRPDGPAVKSLGKGKFVTRLGRGPRLGAAATTPSIAVRILGGDVSYFGSVLRRGANRWQPASFGGCGHHKLCFTPSNSEPYGHRVGKRFVSISNNCTPNCAAGTEYRVTWRWNAGTSKFVAKSERVLTHF